MELFDFILENEFQKSSLSEKQQKLFTKKIYKKLIKENILREANALVLRGKAVHDAIIKADERVSKERMSTSNFWKNFFKTETNYDFPDVVDDSTDPEILVQLNKFAVDMKANGYKEFDLPMFEKKLGFNRGPEYSEETGDLLKDFAITADMLNKEFSKKVINNDDPKVQEILTILDSNLSIDSEFISQIQKVLDLIQALPDKSTEKGKIGFLQREQKKNELEPELEPEPKAIPLGLEPGKPEKEPDLITPKSGVLAGGCTDSSACNYNENAPLFNASYLVCQYASDPCDYCSGETDGTGYVINGDENGDGICDSDAQPGCMDGWACNYDSSATSDDGSCYYEAWWYPVAEEGGTQGTSDPWNAYVQGSDPIQACDPPPGYVNNTNADKSWIHQKEVISGCTDPDAANYDADAIDDDGSCEYEGCTDSTAPNYEWWADIDDGSCLDYVFGCTDETAENYDPNATVDDGTCEYEVFELGVPGTVMVIGNIDNDATSINGYNEDCQGNCCPFSPPIPFIHLWHEDQAPYYQNQYPGTGEPCDTRLYADTPQYAAGNMAQFYPDSVPWQINQQWEYFWDQNQYMSEFGQYRWFLNGQPVNQATMTLNVAGPGEPPEPLQCPDNGAGNNLYFHPLYNGTYSLMVADYANSDTETSNCWASAGNSIVISNL